MMVALTGMDVSNASLYDGASALAEAVLMAVRANRKSKSKRILMPRTVHPAYRRVVRNIVKNQQIELVELPFDPQAGIPTWPCWNSIRARISPRWSFPSPISSGYSRRWTP